jgi:hypothetical protein
MPVIPALRRLRKEELKFNTYLHIKFMASLDYMSRPCLKKYKQLGAVTHACNLSYSDGRDQKDSNLAGFENPAKANSSQTLP